MSSNCVVIGITGGSGSGKSCLVRDVISSFATRKITVLSQDDYYLDRKAHPEEESGYINFDVPQALDLAALVADIDTLMLGKSVKRKKYQYNLVEEGAEYILQPAELLLVEGLFLGSNPQLRTLLEHVVYVEAAEHLRLIRRIKRDRLERNYPLEEVLYRYEHHVMPSYYEHVAPLKTEADLIIDNSADYHQCLNQLLEYLNRKLEQ